MIVVTGVAGFIGSRVARLLLDQGQTVMGIDNLNDAYDVRLKHWRLEHLLGGYPALEFHAADVTDIELLRTLLHGREITAVINLAARAGVRPSVENPWTYYETNVTGTLNLLHLCKELQIPKFVLASTSSVYGLGERPFAEKSPSDRPLSPYAASKKAAENLTYTYHHLHGLDVTVLRYFTVYGPAGRPDMSIYRFIHWISRGEPVRVSGNGHQERDFTYVEDIARGTVAALRPVGFDTINLGGDHPVSIRTIIETLESLLETKANIQMYESHASDVPATWADVTHAKDVLGWGPETALRDGLRQTVEWHQANRHTTSELRLD